MDVAGFGDHRRTNTHQLLVRRRLYDILGQSLGDAGVPWADCDHEDRGDGVFVLIPPDVPKSVLVEAFPDKLAAALQAHNDGHGPAEQIRLRLAVHAGEINYDEYGATSRAVNLAFRLANARVLSAALAASTGHLAIIASAWFFDEVIIHSPAADATAYQRVRVRAKETDVDAWIRLPGWDRGPAGVPPEDHRDSPVPRQLPAHSRQFVGRAAEVTRLMELLDARTVVITAIEGTAGIGKTALAMHWAHRIKDAFPDGQLHVDLRGFDSREPVDPSQALHGFLLALGVGSEAVPDSLDDKASLYRSLIAGRRLLIVLDNARSTDQVRPLLPGTPGCLAIVTSRNRLDGLMIREGAHRVALDTLSVEDSLTLLAERIGRTRLDDDAAAAARELVELCVRLPLALSIAAARTAEHPDRPIGDVVRELRDERGRLDVLDLGDTDLSPRAVFSWSYRVLTPDAARLFRRLGVHPGPDLDVHAARAVLGSPSATVQLRELVKAQLITEHTPGRFRFHDLLRVYAAELAERESETDDACAALLTYYLHAAVLADRHIQPSRGDLAEIITTVPVVSLPRIRSYADAMAWFTVEHSALLSLISLAAERDLPTHAWQLAWAYTTFLRRTGRCEDRVTAHQTALEACRRGGDRQGQSVAARHLAGAVNRLGRCHLALSHLGPALEIARALGDETGQHKAHLTYAGVFQTQGRPADAYDSAGRAWEIARRDDSALRQADALTSMGRSLFLMGRYDEAGRMCARALELYSRIEHLEGQADVLITIGGIERRLGRPAEAMRAYARSLELDRRLGDRYWTAIALEHIADTHRELGEPELAERSLRTALTILREIHHHEAQRLYDKLHESHVDNPDPVR